MRLLILLAACSSTSAPPVAPAQPISQPTRRAIPVAAVTRVPTPARPESIEQLSCIAGDCVRGPGAAWLGIERTLILGEFVDGHLRRGFARRMDASEHYELVRVDAGKCSQTRARYTLEGSCSDTYRIDIPVAMLPNGEQIPIHCRADLCTRDFNPTQHDDQFSAWLDPPLAAAAFIEEDFYRTSRPMMLRLDTTPPLDAFTSMYSGQTYLRGLGLVTESRNNHRDVVWTKLGDGEYAVHGPGKLEATLVIAKSIVTRWPRFTPLPKTWRVDLREARARIDLDLGDAAELVATAQAEFASTPPAIDRIAKALAHAERSIAAARGAIDDAIAALPASDGKQWGALFGARERLAAAEAWLGLSAQVLAAIEPRARPNGAQLNALGDAKTMFAQGIKALDEGTALLH